MMGIIYLIKSNEYIGYHPDKGFFRTETLKYLDENILWLSNMKSNQIRLRNIKNDMFFNIRIKDIIYYYNINHLPANEQFKVILGLYKSVIDIFKEEYSYFNFKIDELLSLNNFSEILFKSKLKIIRSPSLLSVKSSFNKEVFFEKISGNKFFISHFSSADYVTALFDLQIPCGDAKIIDIEKYSNHKDPFKIIDTISREHGFMIKCKVKNDIFVDSFFKEKTDESWFTDIELFNLRGLVELEAIQIMVFTERFRLKEVMRTRFKTRYNNFPYEVFVKNLFTSLKDNNLDTLDIWMDSFHKIFYLKKTIEIINEGIEVGYCSGNNVVISLEDISKVGYLENIGLIYPIKLISYILNN